MLPSANDGVTVRKSKSTDKTEKNQFLKVFFYEKKGFVHVQTENDVLYLL